MIKCPQFNEEILDLFSDDNINNFHFFIILNNLDKFYYQNKNFLIQNPTSNEKLLTIFIDKIKKYFLSENYIKINGKNILGIFNSSFTFQFIKFFRRKKIIKSSIRIYIISIFNDIVNSFYYKSSKSFFGFPPKEIWFENKLGQKYFYNYYYHNLFINKKTYIKFLANFFIINGSNPEKFYIILKKYLNFINQEKDRILLINAWNNYIENLYLEPNEEFGFSYLNYFSKAFFNLNDEALYNLEILKNKCKIAIQVHLFYEELIKDIINKTNNIPVKFDLYISIVFPGKHDNLLNYIKVKILR